MTGKDPVRDYLQETGSAQEVIEQGLEGLVEGWEKLVHSIENGYALGLDDYLNDLDVRQLLEEALLVATAEQHDEVEERINLADQKMKSLVTPTTVCLWGDEIAQEEGWTDEKNWWYFSRPIKANKNLLAEIDEATGH